MLKCLTVWAMRYFLHFVLFILWGRQLCIKTVFMAGSDDPHRIKNSLKSRFTVVEYLMSFYVCFDNIMGVEVFSIVSVFM